MANQKSKFQHVCEVDGKILFNYQKGFKCQFECTYRDIREKYYDDFYDDFYEHEGKHYCPFHAPMKAKKILGKQINMTKEDLLGFSYNQEMNIIIKPYLNKFYNTIYGIINNQIKFFSEKIEKNNYESTNEERIDLCGVVFPRGLSLTKHGEHCCAEHKNYIDSKDSFIPFLYFNECEINGNLEIKAGPQEEMQNFFTKEISQEIYPKIYIDGAYFFNSIFRGSIFICGVDFANKKLKGHSLVNFDNTKFQCRFIHFDNSIFKNFSLKNSQIFSYRISFENILVHYNFDISCADDARDETKRVKSAHGINFSGAQFGDKNTYEKLTSNGEDIGGTMICENRIFDCDVSFSQCSFYQAPNFYNTKFNKDAIFEFAYFFQSCYKQHYYNHFRSLRFEMARKNLYREESMFWRREEKCLEAKTIFITNWPKFFIYKIISVFKFFSKKARKEKYDTFTISQGFIERWLSKLFDMVCERGTSFGGILLSIVILPLLIFPILYFYGSVIYECINKWGMIYDLDFIKICFKESFAKSMLYTFDPFHIPENKNTITRVSFELALSYFQSIIQITLYVIFGFMLKRRFRISN
jgi:hypothetical protein